MNTTELRALRKQLKPADYSVADGTVLRFYWTYERSYKPYHFVAIWIAATARWYLSGNVDLERNPKRNILTMDDMAKLLRQATDIEVASDWTAL